MARFASQYIFCSPHQVQKRMVIEQNQDKTIIQIFSMDNEQVESANTVFYNGILSSEIISIRLHLGADETETVAAKYQYIDVREQTIPFQIDNKKQLIIDFGTNKPSEINGMIEKLFALAGSISIVEIIAACTYYPALIVKHTAKLEVNNKTNIILWEGIDLVNKQLSKQTKLKILSQ